MSNPLEHYHEEMAEFAKMNEGIKDIDYYKSAVEAAQNGQNAAMKQAELYKKGYARMLTERDSLAMKLDDTQKVLQKVLVFMGLACIVMFILGIVIGAFGI